MSTGKKNRTKDFSPDDYINLKTGCRHPKLTSAAYLAFIMCTACEARWTKTKEGHQGTYWILLNEKGGDKPNDDDVSQKSPEGRRVSRDSSRTLSGR